MWCLHLPAFSQPYTGGGGAIGVTTETGSCYALSTPHSVFGEGNARMQFLDHFHPPLSTVRHWEALHARWAAAIADTLNDTLLPGEYFAEVQVHVGSRVEVDVGTFEDTPARLEPRSGAGTATVCSSYLQQGIGLMIIDIVTSRQANLHNALAHQLHASAPCFLPEEILYAMAYRPRRHTDTEEIEVWTATLAIGQSLPVLP